MNKPFKLLKERTEASRKRVHAAIKKIRKPTPPPGKFHETTDSAKVERRKVKAELKDEINRV